MDDIENSDIVFAYVWKVSAGTSMEIFWACRIAKTVIVVCPDIGELSPWIRYHSHVQFVTMAGAIQWLKELS